MLFENILWLSYNDRLSLKIKNELFKLNTFESIYMSYCHLLNVNVEKVRPEKRVMFN